MAGLCPIAKKQARERREDASGNDGEPQGARWADRPGRRGERDARGVGGSQGDDSRLSASERWRRGFQQLQTATGLRLQAPDEVPTAAGTAESGGSRLQPEPEPEEEPAEGPPPLPDEATAIRWEAVHTLGRDAGASARDALPKKKSLPEPPPGRSASRMSSSTEEPSADVAASEATSWAEEPYGLGYNAALFEHLAQSYTMTPIISDARPGGGMETKEAVAGQLAAIDRQLAKKNAPADAAPRSPERGTATERPAQPPSVVRAAECLGLGDTAVRDQDELEKAVRWYICGLSTLSDGSVERRVGSDATPGERELLSARIDARLRWARRRHRRGVEAACKHNGAVAMAAGQAELANCWNTLLALVTPHTEAGPVAEGESAADAAPTTHAQAASAEANLLDGMFGATVKRLAGWFAESRGKG